MGVQGFFEVQVYANAETRGIQMAFSLKLACTVVSFISRLFREETGGI